MERAKTRLADIDAKIAFKGLIKTDAHIST
jgi:hypothetical protein